MKKVSILFQFELFFRPNAFSHELKVEAKKITAQELAALTITPASKSSNIKSLLNNK
jgi:hypothetical protein